MLSDSIEQAMKHKNQFYFDLLKIENEDLQYRIEKDINRTYLVKLDKVSKEYRNSNFLEFRDKKKILFNVLKAYGNFEKEVSYCQGTNYIVALLLYHLDSERLVFWIFHQIMNKFLWRFIYLNHTPKLIRLVETFKKSVHEQLPEISKYFEKLDVN